MYPSYYPIRFVSNCQADPRFRTEDGEFVCKLPFSNNGTHRGTVKSRTGGVAGILKSLEEFINNPFVAGYIDEAIIQPFWPYNTEAKVVCFDGKAIFRNQNKRGRLSGFNKASDKVLFALAEETICQIRSMCPELMVDAVLRVDFFGEPLPDGTFRCLVNGIEGYEASLWGNGSKAGDNLAKLSTMLSTYWLLKLDIMINIYLENRKGQNS